MKKWFVRVLAVLLAATTVLPAQIMAPPVQAVTQAEINGLKKEADNIEARKKELEKQLGAVTADKKDAVQQKKLLEDQIDVLQSEIDVTTRQIGKYDELIQGLEGQLADNEKEEQRLNVLLQQCVRYMEEEGNTGYWGILFGATSFSDFLDRFIIANEIVDYNQSVLDDLAQTREEIRQEKNDLETARTEQQAAKDKLVTSRKEVEKSEAKVDTLIAGLSKEEDELEHSVKALEAQAKAMDAEIARKEKELASKMEANGEKITSESGYLWPLPNHKNLSSLFAGRKDPFTGKPATHTGIDIPAPKGTPVLAAKSGVVITSAYNSGGYGNYVVVSHGNGNTTLYAHLSARSVKEGDKVKQGQVLGKVGSTGRSTGNHLHYEIRVNNVRIDPVTKYKGLTYKGKPL